MLQKVRIKIVAFYTNRFFLLHTLFTSAAKQNVAAIAVFLSKVDHGPLFSYIYYETILVGIGFNINNKHHILPIVYTIAV